MLKKIIFLVLFSSICFSSYTQESQIITALDSLLNYNLTDTKNLLKKLNNSEESSALTWHFNALLYGIKDSTTVKNNYSKPSVTNILNLIKESEILKTHYYNKDSIVFENLKLALNHSKKINNNSLIRFSYRNLLKHTFRNRKLYNIAITYANEYEQYSKNATDIATYIYFKNTLIAYNKRENRISDYKIALKKLDNKNDNYSKGILNQIIGIQEMHFNKNGDTAIKYLNEAKKSFELLPGYIGETSISKVNSNLGVCYNRLNKPYQALNSFRKVKLFKLGRSDYLSNAYLYQATSETYESLKQFDSALLYSKKEKQALNELNEYENAIKLKDIETKYQTAEKEKQILIEQEKKKRFRNGVIALGSLLILGSIIFFLIQKNTKRKQLLAEQEKELETQKVTTLLKEQELTAIDAMIEGQEKERQRIANDLHDDLGGLMATVKLHFNALKEKQSPELYNKTNELLDEAYNKVRSVAHAKNSGVMAKKGLLKALNDMAKTVSASNQLQVDIFDHGLDERLENSLELTIFRIVQELITNIIKHAEASEASIHITKHEDSLNIMVEDNGKGFNTKNIAKKSGMGIHSIDTRIENLGGNVTIESEIQKGTTVIIDIPS